MSGEGGLEEEPPLGAVKLARLALALVAKDGRGDGCDDVGTGKGDASDDGGGRCGDRMAGADSGGDRAVGHHAVARIGERERLPAAIGRSGLNSSMATINRKMTRRGARVDGGGSDWRSNRWVGQFGRVARTFH
uniref:DUF834 domain-containing protein n=1 Tax=Oryza sativa subsp. japonica TaxID=39947 RepID=Q5Z5M6_ORYSJ|nr:hypothetical protein [Oryza sativa Japonica Group]